MSAKQIEEMCFNEKISLFSAPQVIGDYIIKKNITIYDSITMMTVLMDMSKLYTFLFANDMWEAVAVHTMKYIDHKRAYLDDCYKNMDCRGDFLYAEIAHLSIMCLQRNLGGSKAFQELAKEEGTREEMTH